MTAKEAIETLKANYPDACYGQLREAVDAAIEALKAQDVAGDTIYRQAAIDTVQHAFDRETLLSNFMRKIAVDALKTMPPAQLESEPTCNNRATDCISRQAAIYELYKMLHDCFWADDEELDAVITTLNDLPPVHPDPSDVARTIATILENEQDMRVILKNAQNDIIHCEDCKFCYKAPDWKHRRSFGESVWCCSKNRGLNFAETVEPDDYCSSAKRRTDEQTD